MSRANHEITAADLISLEDYARVRREKRAAHVARKRLRRLAVGPHVTVTFECWDSMWLQIQEMLYVEKGGEAQIADELRAYNPMIPNGRELTATLMFEIDDRRLRERTLSSLGGVEHQIVLDVAGTPVRAEPEGDVERSTAAGRTSAVHFLHFPFPDAAIRRFQAPDAPITFAIEHPNYAHMTRMPAAMRQELAKDFKV